jgi:hypothetical protein
VDPEKFQENIHVQEVTETVGFWEFKIEGMDKTLRIKVQKHLDGRYMGITNFAIKNPTQAAPYQSLMLKSSVQEAIEDALNGFLLYWHPKDAEKTELIPVENF